MLPQSLLPSLSPTAAKLFLCLLSLQDDSFTAPNAARIHAPLRSLAQLANLSPRTCKRALAELRSLRLLSRLPRKYHQPATYLLSLAPQTNGPPMTPNPAKRATPVPTPAPSSRPTPQNTPKIPTVPPMAPLLNTTQNPSTRATLDTFEAQLDAFIDPALIKSLLAQLPPEQNALVASAHAALALLERETATPAPQSRSRA